MNKIPVSYQKRQSSWQRLGELTSILKFGGNDDSFGWKRTVDYTGSGDVLEPENNIASVGSGGNFALKTLYE